ncbi:putative reverse transcriptase domain-containing protein [Tanacetum coccineum]|uniref:Reverse transcriptase domain-containing protein n=1 Tax=Tanacetum coccineum TaxID=301880 RepID=A0ABQ5BMW4_9ASTR
MKCPKGGNRHNEGARVRAYVMGTENPQQNLNVVTGTFLVNDHYACILFDSGAEKSFVSTAFNPFINTAPATLDTSYRVELADGKVVSTNTVLRGCTLALYNHCFKIDLLPTRLGSFDVIVGMDWLSYHRGVIVFYEKIVRIPLPNGEILKIQGERLEKDPKLLSCIKADEKKPEDIRIVCNLLEVFSDDLSGLPPVREIEFPIDLIPGALRAQVKASKDLKAPAEWLIGLETHFKRRDDGGIYFFDRIWIPSVGDIRKLIMDEAQTSRYSLHPGADKMYYDLRDLYWCPGMKRDIVDYVSKCLTCSKIKAEHQKPSGLLQQPKIPEWKWEKIIIDLVIKLPKSSSGSPVIWTEVGESQLIGPEIIQETTEKIFQIKERKLAPRYVGPFEIVECVGPVAYRLKLPQELSCIHDTFHVSNLKKCLAESDFQVPLEEIENDENLRFVEEPIKIMARDVKKLKRRRIPLVKVRWNSRQGVEYTWEREDQFKTK